MESWTPDQVNAWAAVTIAVLTVLLAASAGDAIYHRWVERRRKLGIDLIEPCFTNVLCLSYDHDPEEIEYDQIELVTFVYFRLRIRNISIQDNSILSVEAFLDGALLGKSIRNDKRTTNLIYNGHNLNKIRYELLVPQDNYRGIDKNIGRYHHTSDASLYQFSREHLGVGKSIERELTLTCESSPIATTKSPILQIVVKDVHRRYVCEQMIRYNSDPPEPF